MDWESAMPYLILGRVFAWIFFRNDVRYLCIIKLEVHIPGREQYVTVVRKPLNRAERAAVQPGNTVQVRVDPDDDPKNVRIDLSQPMPPQMGSFGPPPSWGVTPYYPPSRVSR
jgi:hypothetical protein